MTDRLTDADLDAIAEQIGCPSAVQAVQIGEYEACARSLVEHGAGKLLAEVRLLQAELTEERLRVRALQAAGADHARDRDTIERILAALDGEQ